MGRKKSDSPEKTPWMIKRKLDEILNSDMHHPGKPLTLHGNDYGGKRRTEVIIAKQQKNVVTIKGNIIRIQEQADPLAFLISVQNGDLIPVTYVDDDGNVCTTYQQAAIKDRVEVAKYLANKILPSLSVTKHIVENDASEADPNAGYDPNRPGQPSYAQLVAMAADRRRTGFVPDGRVTDVVSIGEMDDGGTDGQTEEAAAADCASSERASGD
jgi:hypothetical protein